jgi:branched-chain amino acid aminotransferase
LFFHLAERLHRLREIADELAVPFPYDEKDIREALAVTYDMGGGEGRDVVLELLLIAGAKTAGGAISDSVAVIPENRPSGPAKAAEAVPLASLASFPMAGSALLLERSLSARMGTCLARARAMQQGAREAILLDQDGFIGACTGGELFIVRENGIWMPELARLPASTAFSLELLGDMEVKVGVQKLKLRDLKAAKECFLLNELEEIVPVASIDGSPIGGGKAGTQTTTLALDFAARLRLASRPAF